MATPTNTETRRSRRRVTATMHRITERIPRAPNHGISTLSRRRAEAQPATVSRTTTTNVALAGLQLVLGYQWLVSGTDKLLLGNFPAAMGGLLNGTLASGKLSALFAALLRMLVLPNATLFGYAIMLGETLAGLGLIAAGLFMLARPFGETHLRGRLWLAFARTDRVVMGLAPLAAVGATMLALSYYLLDGAPTLWFTPSIAYGGAIAPEMILALASLVAVIAQVPRLLPTH